MANTEKALKALIKLIESARVGRDSEWAGGRWHLLYSKDALREAKEAVQEQDTIADLQAEVERLRQAQHEQAINIELRIERVERLESLIAHDVECWKELTKGHSPEYVMAFAEARVGAWKIDLGKPESEG